MRTFIASAGIIPQDFYGRLSVSKVTLAQVRKTIRSGFTSAVGHKATALALSDLLDRDIPVQRVMIGKLAAGDQIIVFQLKRRLKEGEVLGTIADIDAVGYTLKRVVVTSVRKTRK